MNDASKGWVSASEALDRAAAVVAGDRGRATTSIREKARIGLIRSRARSLESAGSKLVSEVNLPPSFWAAPTGLLALARRVALEDWNLATFEGQAESFGSCRAYGVEFLRKDIDHFYPARTAEFAATDPTSSRPKRGRKPGVGGYAQSDLPLITKMHRLILSGEAKSPYHAAVLITHLAAPENTLPESRTKRLVDRYKRHHGMSDQ